MENKTLEILTMNKYIIRSTGEKVEVIDSNVASRGERSGDDWVTYIDSKGVEHIKEYLNLQLDFKYGKDFVDLFGKMFEAPKFEPMKFPSTENSRAFETAKALIVHKDIHIEEAITIGKQLAEAFKE